MRTYFMNSKRLTFTNWTENDLDFATSLWGCEDVARYICANGMFHEEEIRQRLHFEIAILAKYQVQYWPIFERNTHAFIGCCGLRPLLDSYELGCHLLKEHWHQGYAIEACEQVISYAFSIMKLTHLYAGHHPDNIASKNILKKRHHQNVWVKSPKLIS